MLEESLDPRPSLDVSFAAVLSGEARESAALAAHNLHRFWDDRRNDWSNLRDVRHWLERGAGRG
jgi:hypothetical protein